MKMYLYIVHNSYKTCCPEVKSEIDISRTSTQCIQQLSEDLHKQGFLGEQRD